MIIKELAAGVIAAAGCTGTAFAQAAVTVYGVIDSGVLYQSTSARSLSSVAPNTGKVYRFHDAGLRSSHWGMKGSEDLGGGYRAVFQLQGSFNSGSGRLNLSSAPGQQAVFNQIASVGISGAFGTVTAGRQTAPMFNAMSDTDVRGARFFGSILTAWLGANQAAGWPGTSTNAPIGALYDDNAIVYRSLPYRGLALALEYAPGGVAGHFHRNTRKSVAVTYSDDALVLAATCYQGDDINPHPARIATSAAAAPTTGVHNNRLVYFGGKYTIHGVSVSASYGHGKTTSHAGSTNHDLYSTGLGYAFSSALGITTGLYHLRSRGEGMRPTGSSTEAAIGAEYRLSKRTEVYAQVGHVNNTADMNQLISFGQPVAPGVSTTAAMVGTRHKF